MKKCSIVYVGLKTGVKWLDGDFKAQVDRKIFQEDNGLRNLILRLNGNPYFTYVNLEKSERSPVAALADLLD